ncbi:Tenascin-N [Acipenser ruthenus]|uniref:Tenascin-N n=1 Tax=Acipenser ruthenus TaxID=7906 RepID=A0A662YRK3_ACIRT|nr:Tenascin-N [Acipenser ruthenus]
MTLSIRPLLLLGVLCVCSVLITADKPAPDQTGDHEVTFRHIYKIDLPTSSDCKVELDSLPAKDEGTEPVATPVGLDADNNMVFKHNIRLHTPKCDCGASEAFKSVLFRLNRLEGEVTYLKDQCSQGCCGGGAGLASLCSGHGTFKRDTCGCDCDEGWEGEDCSRRSCPNECNDNGRCVDGKCVCYEGYTGVDCSEQLCLNDCSDKGRCVDGKCQCFSGFTDEDCSQRTCLNDCSSNGECDDGVCICEEGFFGDDCSQVLGPKDFLLVKASEESLLVNWDYVPGAEYYLLTYYPEGAEGNIKQIKVPKTKNSHLITGLTSGVNYIINLYTFIKDISSEPSNLEASTVVSSIDSVKVVSQMEHSIHVEWKNPPTEVDFFKLTIVNPEGQENEVRVQMAKGAKTSYIIRDLQPGSLYLIKVQSVKEDIEGKPSSVNGVTEIDAPTNLRVTDAKKASGVVTWTPPQAVISGYILTYKRADGKGQEAEETLSSTDGSYLLGGMEQGVHYIVRLVAFRGAMRSKTVETTFTTVGELFPFPMDCTQAMKNGNTSNGIYTIYLNSDRSKPMKVYCDMTTDGGGWIVIQRRNSGKIDFLKRWKNYTQGFGDMNEEFWLGLDKMYDLTNSQQYELRVDLRAGSESVYAVYDNFKLAPARQKYQLTIGNYRGTAGDAMTYHQGRAFTTVDRDNDIALSNCAFTHRGAWWYKNCHLANLNGQYGQTTHSVGVNWKPWKGHEFSIPFAEMKIRPRIYSENPVLGRKKRSLAGRGKRRTE